MATGQPAKSELLAAAQAVLDQDDREQAETSKRHRRNRLLTALLVASLLIIGMAPLIAARHSKPSTTHPSPQPAAVQVQ